MFTQWVPHTWNAQPHAAELEAYADRVVARMDAVAPGFADSVLHRQVIGPHEMEHEYGLVGGNIFHGELTVGQMFHARPAATSSARCSPTAGPWLCGGACGWVADMGRLEQRFGFALRKPRQEGANPRCEFLTR